MVIQKPEYQKHLTIYLIILHYNELPMLKNPKSFISYDSFENTSTANTNL